MAEITGRIPTKPGLTTPKLTTRQWILIASGILVLAGVVGTVLYLMGPGDEPPIRVKNGSMDIELANDTWQSNGDAWSPSKGKNRGKFGVRVESGNNYSCKEGQTASGRVVAITYSDEVTITFTPAGWFYRTRSLVQEKAKLARVTDNPPPQYDTLRYGTPGEGHIRLIEVKDKDGNTTWKCGFDSDEELVAINICPAPHAKCN
jgi:hypothetical protein